MNYSELNAEFAGKRITGIETNVACR